MSKQARNVLTGILVMALAAITCTMPAYVKEPETALSAQEIADTAVAKALAVVPSATPAGPIPVVPSPTFTQTPQQCSATVTANTDANIRMGPGTGYAIAGSLPLGGTASVAGRNDASTWWYIVFAGAPGGYAWIAGSVVTASCIPPVVQVVAAPPLPTAPAATETPKLLLAPWIVPGFELHIVPTATLIPVLEIPDFPDFQMPSFPFP